MKLFTKYSRIIIGITLGIVLIASFGFYSTLKYVQLQQIDADLEIEEEEIQLYIQHYQALPRTMSVEDQLVHFRPITKPFKMRYFGYNKLKDHNQEFDEFRQLTFGVQAEGRWYEVTVSKSLEETDHLIQATLWITLLTVSIILITFLVINRFVLRKLWNPFYRSLEAVKNFSVNSDNPPHFPPTSTEEFNELNSTLKEATQKAKLDYVSLKTFSENASHEIQTPIAIIRAKVDLLLQDDVLTEKQSITLQSISNAVQRLSRLNSSLLLLAKIENNQFVGKDTLNLKEILEHKLAEFDELWKMNRIAVSYSLEERIITINKELLHILLNNLLSNATRHNEKDGNIMIELQSAKLCITNTGDGAMLDAQQLYQRFYNPLQKQDHTGLGLSIIRQICDASRISIQYLYSEGHHGFTLTWKND
jgi:signal transduction histidine kinase